MPFGPIEQEQLNAQTASSRPNASNDSRSHDFGGANVGNERAEGGGVNGEECGGNTGAEGSGDVGGDVSGDVGGDGGDGGGVDGGEANAGSAGIGVYAGELGRGDVDCGSGGGNTETGGGGNDGGRLNTGVLQFQNPDGRSGEPLLSNHSPPIPQGSPASDISAVRSLRNTMDRSGLPDVVDRAFDYFTEAKEWGPSWARCVAAWVAFERARAFKVSCNVPLPCLCLCFVIRQLGSFQLRVALLRSVFG